MDRPPVQLIDRHAADNLRFIRDTMASAVGFTAVPGWGDMLMGVTAVATALVAGPPRDSPDWLRIWVAEGAIALAIGVAGIIRKAHRAGTSLMGPAARRFALAFVPGL